MKVLNLYAGIGGNRKLWEDVEVTAVELDPKIAAIYSDFFPDDKVVIGDAHQYLLDHFAEFDFIWASPPCPTHSRIRLYTAVAKGANKPVYPDMKLYEEIIFLKHHHKGKWVVENVASYYDPLIPPQNIGSHYYWTNFLIPQSFEESRKHHASIGELAARKGFDLSKYTGIDKVKALRNCVEPETAAHILDFAINPIETQGSLL